MELAPISGIRKYAKLSAAGKNEITGLLADLAARFDVLKLDYLAESDEASYDTARQHLRIGRHLDSHMRQFSEQSSGEGRLPVGSIRDLSMAETVEWILQREARIVLLAHNSHIQRTPTTFLGPVSMSTMGHHLAARLGDEYVTIGTTFGSGEIVTAESLASTEFGDIELFISDLSAPPKGTIDEVIETARSEPGIVDLRALTEAEAQLVDATTRMRMGTFQIEVQNREAFDSLIHIPRISLWHSWRNAAFVRRGSTGVGRPRDVATQKED